MSTSGNPSAADASQDARRFLGARASILVAAVAVAAFHLAFLYQPLAFLIAVHLFCLSALAWTRTTRLAFYVGLAIGVATCGPQLAFLLHVFGPAAIGLWLAMGLWTALFLLVARSCVGLLGGKIGALAIPLLWTGWEYFRGELNPLRFTWLNAGQVFSGSPGSLHLEVLGVYGIALAMMVLIAIVRLLPWRFALPAGLALLGGLAWITNLAPAPASPAGPQLASQMLPQAAAESRPDAALAPAAPVDVDSAYPQVAGPFVVAIQLELPSESEVLASLDRAVAQYPQADLLALSEYTFFGAIPDRVRAWCRDNRRHLIAGGTQAAGDLPGGFENTAFVVGPDGNVVFSQAKSVPVQFFDDGLPARCRRVWFSPWGKIGLCVCYDLCYARVTDDFVRQGAGAILCIVLDKISWTEQEHRQHSRFGPIRAAEYRIPVLRACSSGISQIVLSRGEVVAIAPYVGRGEMVAGRLPVSAGPRMPLDRIAAPACVGVSGMLVVAILISVIRRRSARARPRPAP